MRNWAGVVEEALRKPAPLRDKLRPTDTPCTAHEDAASTPSNPRPHHQPGITDVGDTGWCVDDAIERETLWKRSSSGGLHSTWHLSTSEHGKQTSCPAVHAQ